MRLPAPASSIQKDESGLGPYEWRGPCRVPWCDKPATDPHHIVRRSAGWGEQDWIVIGGKPMPNVMGVCRSCHDLLELDCYSIRFVRGQWVIWDSQLDTEKLPLRIETGRVTRTGGKHCPTCGRRWPKPSPYAPPKEGRTWGTYTIRVPDDDEDGGEILRTLLDAAAEAQGFDDTGDGTLDYYALVGALHSALTGELG